MRSFGSFAALLLSLSAAYIGAAGAATCSPIQSDTDYFGNDIKSTAQANPANCCNDCAATPGCVLYVWTSQSGGTCYLKSAASTSSNKQGAQSGFLVPSTCSAIQFDTDYFGNDIKSTAQTNPANCCGDCAATPGCVLYVWTSQSGGTCYLKSAVGTSSNKQGAQSAFLGTTTPTPTPTTCANYQSNVDYPGNDITSTSQINPANCCNDCTLTPGCVLYVWTTQSGGTCYLKSAQGASIGKPGAHSAARSAPSTCSAPLANTDYTGQDLSNVAATSVNQCCAACLAVASCNAYSFKANVCYLKSGSNNQVSLPGVTAVALYRCSAPQFNVDYVDNDIGNVASPSYVRCCELCRNTAGCSAFSWASGVCYLKNAKGATTNTAGVTSATVL